MGCVCVKLETDFTVLVRTGDRRKAGTDATVRIIMYDDAGNTSHPINLDNYFRDDFERGRLDAFKIPSRKVHKLNKQGEISRIEFWKDGSFLGGDWYVDTISVTNNVMKSNFVFPIFRWIKSDFHYQIMQFDTSLPQFDAYPEQREMDLEEKQKTYEYGFRFAHGPVMMKTLPADEQYSFSYKWVTYFQREEHEHRLLGFCVRKQWDFPYLRSVLTAASLLSKSLATGKWESLNALKNVYNQSTFSRPKCVVDWTNDVQFGLQRVIGFNHSVIARVTTIPDKFPVTDSLMDTVLEGLTLQEAIQQKRLFMCDYQILDGCPVKENFVLCHPIGLFFVDSKGILRPVAIQLFQQPGPENPIFTPRDAPLLWTYTKMWYNNADSAHHFAISRFALTQCLMEGFAIAVHRNLSQCHPIFKLLAPHFLYLIAINEKSLNFITAKDEWLDRNLNIGSDGFTALLIKGYNDWRLDSHGLLPCDLQRRGLDDPNILPCFHFRDDALLLYNVIKDYVKSYVTLYYEDDEQIRLDREIQSWAKELVTEKEDGGVGIKGLSGKGELTTASQLTDIVTCSIYTCSVVHAATNFPQYESYSFPPNYPSFMAGKPPTSKTMTISERDLLDSLADKPNTLETIVFSKLFSTKGTNRLGDFEVDFIFDPKAKDIVKEFQKKLKDVSEEIQSRNRTRMFPYPYLDPELIPNNISI